MIDPLGQAIRWLKNFEKQCREGEQIWWLLIHPLMEGGDAAMLALACQLMATWRWATVVSPSPICPPAHRVMNIGQFLEEDTTGCGWSMQQWLEAYTCGLQHVGEAADGRHWRPEGEGFTPKVSPLVEVFIG